MTVVFYHLSYTRIATGVSCPGEALGQINIKKPTKDFAIFASLDVMD